MRKNILENITRFKKSAELVYSSEDYTSSTILLFKTMFSILDYIILIKKGAAPKDHTERFRILQREFPELYKILDKDFSVYRKTYFLSIDKETCEKIKNDVEKIIKEHKIQISNK